MGSGVFADMDFEDGEKDSVVGLCLKVLDWQAVWERMGFFDDKVDHFEMLNSLVVDDEEHFCMVCCCW